MKATNQFIRQYFHFSRKQVNGFWVLMGASHILLGMAFFIKPIDNYTPAQQLADQQLLDSLYNEWQDSLQAHRQAQWNEKKDSKPRSFNPKNREENGANSKQYAPKKKKQKNALEPFDLATADTTQLKQIWGIGSKLSARIIKFRNRLGGFHSMKQLSEVYGLKPEVIEKLNKYCFLGNTAVKTININTAPVRELYSHPYLSKKLAYVIVRYREEHGPFQSMEELKKIHILENETLQKLKPYLSL